MVDRQELADRAARVRGTSVALVEGLSPEDCLVQSMPDASPIKWHLAHTTWFFEVFVLGPHAGQAPQDARWSYLFNSYYEAQGPRQARARRGDLSRPSLAEVMAWRARTDAALRRFILESDAPALLAAAAAIELGCGSCGGARWPTRWRPRLTPAPGSGTCVRCSPSWKRRPAPWSPRPGVGCAAACWGPRKMGRSTSRMWVWSGDLRPTRGRRRSSARAPTARGRSEPSRPAGGRWSPATTAPC